LLYYLNCLRVTSYCIRSANYLQSVCGLNQGRIAEDPSMFRATKFVVLLCLFAPAALADWTEVAAGVDYQRFNEKGMDVHVARIDLTNPELRVIATRESERGLRVSEYAAKNKALVAVNADYFTKEMRPIGLTIGPCGTWKDSRDTEREGVVAVGEGRAAIYPQKHVLDEPEEWMSTAVSGWPLLVRECQPLTATELPGSDGFTRSPHPRTAAGLSEDGTTLYLVVADGRREGIPGFTLAKLARFMAEELKACSAMNFDGGGSSVMWLTDQIVNQPSDKHERRVANHLAVVRAADYTGCDVVEPSETAEK
jgi:exopolysaccharide biosynthesis protein